LVIEVTLKGCGTLIFYVVVEHKAYPDRFVPLQILRYITEKWEVLRKTRKYKYLPHVFPLIFYCGRDNWEIMGLEGIIDQAHFPINKYLNFAPFSFSLKDMPDERLLAVARDSSILYIYKGLLLPNSELEIVQRIAVILEMFKDDPEKLADAKEEMREFRIFLSEEPYGVSNVEISKNLSQLGGEAMTVEEAFKDSITRYANKLLIEEGRVEGRKEGRLEGRKEGRVEGDKSRLLKLIQKHFNSMSQAICEGIQQVKDSAILDRLYDVLSEAKSAKSFEKAAAKVLAGG
jgi:hypothetical protein